ncbi:spherulin-4 [Selaginella moellendorffii]|uniref:spherulin-4 n=1 Tax=Selaginella moellendorffii TaxID=88036 RepID=UPI000D1CD2BA|nr:spherulin-4 [Selaginella moellendorffii]|eukprot:XP_024522685.1 spherulin-4 [Selaginella moellendorffii]
MVPAYIYPSPGNTAWQTLTTQAAQFPYRLVTIINPNNGPGTSAISDYQNAIQAFKNAQGLSLGYVPTTYGNRAYANVISDVDKYYSFYPNISGIFFDEANSNNGSQGYYQNLYRYVKSKSSCSLVVNNPGTATLESYLIYNGSRVTDVICVFEGNNTAQRALTWTQASWTNKYDRSNFLAVAYNISSGVYQSVMDHAYQQNTGWVYVTDDGGNNPYDNIPPYFADQVAYASTYSKNQNCPWNII